MSSKPKLRVEVVPSVPAVNMLTTDSWRLSLVMICLPRCLLFDEEVIYSVVFDKAAFYTHGDIFYLMLIFANQKGIHKTLAQVWVQALL